MCVDKGRTNPALSLKNKLSLTVQNKSQQHLWTLQFQLIRKNVSACLVTVGVGEVWWPWRTQLGALNSYEIMDVLDYFLHVIIIILKIDNQNCKTNSVFFRILIYLVNKFSSFSEISIFSVQKTNIWFKMVVLETSHSILAAMESSCV